LSLRVAPLFQLGAIGNESDHDFIGEVPHYLALPTLAPRLIPVQADAVGAPFSVVMWRRVTAALDKQP
jgi:hypothetical protein